MEIDREIKIEKNDEKKERPKEETHVSYMQNRTDDNSILL